MKKSILEVYALAVCFITVVCFVVALGMAIYGIVGIANPEFTMTSWTYTQHQTNVAFWAGHSGCGADEKKRERPNEADLTKQREESYARAISNERRDSAQMLVKTVIVIIIDLVVFFFHWVIARRARSSAA